MLLSHTLSVNVDGCFDLTIFDLKVPLVSSVCIMHHLILVNVG